MRSLVFLILIGTTATAVRAASPVLVERGVFHARVVGGEKEVPARFRLDERTFSYEMDKKTDLPALNAAVYRLRFPSPVKSDIEENNTVHAEYYRPQGKGPFPGVIILDVTAGNQMLSRHMGAYFANNGVAGLFVQMAYYGPRRPPGSKARLMSPNITQTIAAVTQTVLDLRAATAWMASRPELDANRLGIVGTSLGSFLSALTGEMEPRLGRVCVLLGGGGFIDAYIEHPLAAPYYKIYRTLGGSKETLKKAIAPIDPITCAANLKNRKLLILAASRDDIVPPTMARSLWEATGKQKIVWFDSTHYGAAVHMAEGMEYILEHFKSQ